MTLRQATFLTATGGHSEMTQDGLRDQPHPATIFFIEVHNNKLNLLGHYAR